MKRMTYVVLIFLFPLTAAQQTFAQLNKMNRPMAQVPTPPAKAQQAAPTNMRQATVNNTNNTGSTVKGQSGQLRLSQALPMPKPIMLLTRNKQLSLHSERTLTAHIVTSSSVVKNNTAGHSQMQGRFEEMGVLGVTTKNYDKHKVSYVLTTQTGGWPANPNYDIKAAAAVPDNNDPLWNCTTTIESVNAQSKSFMNASKNEQGQHLYPGAIYTYDDYATGNFRPFENGLNPMEIYTSTQAGNNSFAVQTPNAPSIQQAISNIVGQFNSAQGGAKIIQQTLYADNESDMAIAISAGGAYDGYSAVNTFNHNQAEHHIYITLDAMKSLYTISAQRPQNGFFSNGQIPQAPSALVMVQDVTYGARILANIDITVSSKTDLNKFQFAYNAIAANGFVNVDALAHDASINYKINAYMVGVPASTGIITTLQDFQSQIDHIFSQSNYRNAVPIEYSLSDMEGNLLGVESMTDKFPVRNCTPAAEIFKLQSVYATLQTGSDNKNSESNFNIMLSGSGGDNLITFFGDASTEYKSNSTNTIKFASYVNLPADHPNGYTLNDFANGGMVELTLEYGFAFGRYGDDWDLSNVHMVLNFLSQKGTPLKKDIYINGFRLSSGNGNSDVASKKIYFDADFKAMQ